MNADSISGVLSLTPDGYGFVRGDHVLLRAEDVYVSQLAIRRYRLQDGDRITGEMRPPRAMERYWSIVRVEMINGKAVVEP